MKQINFKKLKIFDPRMDWLSVIGDIPHINRETNEELTAITEIMKKIGFEPMAKRDRPVFRSNIYGIEISFGKKRKTGSPFVKIEFQGQFFADTMENCDHKIKTFVQFIWQAFGVQTAPKISRIDIATDILNVGHKDLFPDFADKRYSIVTNTKQPMYNHSKHYLKEDDPHEETGISVNNSRFEFALYERLLKLDHYELTPHKRWYVDYYRKLYGDAGKVLRIEVRLKKELCEYFNIAYFVDDQPMIDLLKKSLAHFNHHHRIKDNLKDEFLKSFDKLFFREEYESIKTLKLSHNIETDLARLHFSNPYTSVSGALTFIARHLIANRTTTNQDIVELFKIVKKKIVTEADSVENDLINQRKTHNIFKFDQEKSEIYSQLFSDFTTQLRRIKETHPENINSLLEQIKIAPFIKQINDFDPNRELEDGTDDL